VREARAERLAIEELRDGIEAATFVADVEKREHVGVRERSDGAGLALEAADEVGVGKESLRQDLDRHLAAEARVLRPVDLSHSALAERRADLVGAQPVPG